MGFSRKEYWSGVLHWLNGHEFEPTPGDSGGQRSLACYSPRGPNNNKCVAQEGTWPQRECRVWPGLSDAWAFWARNTDKGIWSLRSQGSRERAGLSLSSWFRKGLIWYSTHIRHTLHTHTHLQNRFLFACLFLFWLHCLCWVGRLSYPLVTKFWVGILVLWPWIKREYPALKGGFLTTGPPRKLPEQFLNTGQALAMWRQYQVQVRQFLPGGYAVLWKPGQSRWDQKLVLLLMLPLFPRSAVS